MLANFQLLSDILKNVKNGQDVVVEQTFYKAKEEFPLLMKLERQQMYLLKFMLCLQVIKYGRVI